jgi:hypothetical protein
MHRRWSGTRSEAAGPVENQGPVGDSHYREGVEGSTLSHSRIPSHPKGPEIFTEAQPGAVAAQVNALAEVEEAEEEALRGTT